jgi:peptidyl-prolyl cis-trans isomerase C
MRCSHILIAHEDATRSQRNVSREEALFLIADIQKKLLNKELTFEQAAKMFSDCPSGKANGGDLGVIKRNQMDKDFMIYLDGLQPGETNGISCTVFGFHIIRRNQDVTINQSP